MLSDIKPQPKLRYEDQYPCQHPLTLQIPHTVYLAIRPLTTAAIRIVPKRFADRTISPKARIKRSKTNTHNITDLCNPTVWSNIQVAAA